MIEAILPGAASAAGRSHGFELEVLHDTDARAWGRRLADLERAGGAVTVYHRLEWLRSHRAGGHRLVTAVGPNGLCRCACALTIRPVRTLPGHRVLEVERFQGGNDPAGERAVLRGLAQLARRTPRLLAARVRLLSPDPVRRRGWTDEFAAAGFRAAPARLYQRTAVVALEPPADAIMAGFHSTARRHIRAVDKNPTALRAITDAGLAGRMQALIEETRARTGGTFQADHPAQTIEFAVRYPHRARVVGLFRTDSAGPDSLLAFAVGYLHGDHAEYATAASTRRTDLKLPLSYGLAWDLMRWAKANGAAWFDFGGITPGTHGDRHDPLGGISDFKRYFAPEMVDIAEEWTIEPNPLRAKAAIVLRSLANRRGRA